MSDQSKKEFEAHYMRYMEKQTGLILPDMQPNYDNPTVGALLDFWQASRAALVVELPPAPDPRSGGGDYYFGMTHGINDCREAITKTGVRVK